MRERLYDAACFLMATREGGMRGEYTEPSGELSFTNFIQPLLAKVLSMAATQAKTAPAPPPVIEYAEEPAPGEVAPGKAPPPPPDED